jgi:hypothetical protein
MLSFAAFFSFSQPFFFLFMQALLFREAVSIPWLVQDHNLHLQDSWNLLHPSFDLFFEMIHQGAGMGGEDHVNLHFIATQNVVTAIPALLCR